MNKYWLFRCLFYYQHLLIFDKKKKKKTNHEWIFDCIFVMHLFKQRMLLIITIKIKNIRFQNIGKIFSAYIFLRAKACFFDKIAFKLSRIQSEMKQSFYGLTLIWICLNRYILSSVYRNYQTFDWIKWGDYSRLLIRLKTVIIYLP